MEATSLRKIHKEAVVRDYIVQPRLGIKRHLITVCRIQDGDGSEWASCNPG